MGPGRRPRIRPRGAGSPNAAPPGTAGPVKWITPNSDSDTDGMWNSGWVNDLRAKSRGPAVARAPRANARPPHGGGRLPRLVVPALAGVALPKLDPIPVRVERGDSNAERVIDRLGIIECHAALPEPDEVPSEVVRLDEDRPGNDAPTLRVHANRPPGPQEDLHGLTARGDRQEAAVRSEDVHALLEPQLLRVERQGTVLVTHVEDHVHHLLQHRPPPGIFVRHVTSPTPRGSIR